jgi:hypothetical protein
MAFLKYATAQVVRPQVSGKAWGKMRKASVSKGELSTSLIDQATEVLGESFDPAKYLLTHCTIVASVDVESVPNVKLGSVTEDGQKIMRKYSDYRVTTETQKFANHNFDCWSREVLLKSYKTFVGGHNFQEHVQLEELSKGRIIDAVARDIGPSVYVDILVATDRKHTQLIEDILSGKMSTLSMGCFRPGTQVSLANGVRVPIEEIQVGDMVRTHTGKAQKVANKHQMRSTWNMRTIRAVGLPSAISSTNNHEYLVFRPSSTCGCGCGQPIDPRHHVSPERRMNQRFLVGHQLRIYNPNDPLKNTDEARQLLASVKEWKPEWVRADEIQVGDYLCFPKGGKETELPEGASVGKARLLGYFLAEGSYLKYHGKHAEVQFNFSLTEKDTYAAEVVALLKSEFPQAGNPWVQEREERNTVAVHCTGSDMVQWFHRHAGEYSYGKQISSEVMSWPTHLLGHLAGAWINGDGCLVKQNGGVIYGATASYALATQLQLILAQCGVYARLECSVTGHARQVSDVIDEDGIGIRDDDTGKLPAFFLKVGNTQAPKLQEYTDKVPESSCYSQASCQETDDYILFKVKSVLADEYSGWVYDLGVEEDHSYIVEGATVHNCFTDETCCTYCGHVAADETELCKHIRFMKGSTFYDDKGRKNVIGELCGHSSLDPHGGVKFIEASWVETPAFTGAVLRNVLEAEKVSPEVIKKAELVLASPPPQWMADKYQKAANVLKTLAKNADWGDPEEGGGDEPAADPAAPEAPSGPDPFSDLEKDIQTMVLDKVRQKVRDKINEDQAAKLTPENSTAKPNDNIVKQASRDMAYRAAVLAIARTASSDIEFMEKLAQYNMSVGIDVPAAIYRSTLKVGSTDNMVLLHNFVKSCRVAIGRMPKNSGTQTLMRLGKFLSKREVN